MSLNKNILRILLFLIIFSSSLQEEKNKFKEIIQQYLSKLDINNAYLSYDQYISLLNTLQKDYQDYLILSSIGKTFEGNDIPLITMKSPLINKDNNESKINSGILINGMHHGREPVSMMMNIYLILHLLSLSQLDLHLILSYTNIYFIPIINIDTYKYNSQKYLSGQGIKNMMARKNRRVIPSKKCKDEDIGIDLNRNYDYDFGKDNEGSSNNPCQEDYRGEKPFSEPETKAIKDFVDSHPDIKIVYNYHTWGNLVITAFNCLSNKDSDNLIKKNFPIHYSMYEDFKKEAEFPKNFIFGNADKTIKYRANGDATDWFLGKKNILSFSPELGNGNKNSDYFYPNREVTFDVLEKNLRSGLYAMQKSMFYLKGELISANYYNSGNEKKIYKNMKEFESKKFSLNDVILDVKAKIINKGFNDYLPGIEIPQNDTNNNSTIKYLYFLNLDLSIDIDKIETICYWNTLQTIYISEISEKNDNERHNEKIETIGKFRCYNKDKNDLNNFKIFIDNEIKSMKYIILNIFVVIKKEAFFEKIRINKNRFLDLNYTKYLKNETEIMKIGSKGKIISLDANNEIIEWKFNTVNISIKIKDLKDQVSFRTNIIYVSHKALFFICVVIIICIVAMIFYVRKIYRRNANSPLINISLENNNDNNFNNEQIVNNLENANQQDINLRNNENIQAVQIPRSENEVHPGSNTGSPSELNA